MKVTVPVRAIGAEGYVDYKSAVISTDSIDFDVEMTEFERRKAIQRISVNPVNGLQFSVEFDDGWCYEIHTNAYEPDGVFVVTRRKKGTRNAEDEYLTARGDWKKPAHWLERLPIDAMRIPLFALERIPA